MKLLPGDVVCMQGQNMGSKLIRFFTRTIGEPRTKVNHIAIVTRGGNIEDVEVVEALHTVKRRRLDRRADGQTKVAVFRRAGLRMEQRQALARHAEAMVGQRYSYFKIGLQFLDWLCLGTYFWRRLGGMDRRPICSWLVAYLYQKRLRIRFGGPYEKMSPDDMWDWMNSGRGQWARVRDLTPL